MQKKNKANLALGISAAGFLGTLSLSGGFLPGLFHHGFLAATIGGLADWFAVTAIFRKPLGISYRTDILRRNRGRIMDSIVTFASEDLLSTQNIMSVLSEQDMSRLMADYLEHRAGRERVREAVDTASLRIAATVDTRAVAEVLAPALQRGLGALTIETVVADLLSLLAEEPQSECILEGVRQVGQQMLTAPAFQQAMLQEIRILRQNYEKDSAGRAFILSSLGLTDERILALLTEKLGSKLNDCLEGKTQNYAGVKAGLETMLRTLGRDERLLDMLHDWREKLLSRLDLTKFVEEWLTCNIQGSNPVWLGPLNAFVDARIDEFVSSVSAQQRFDELLKHFLADELNRHHELIPGLIRERLNEFSDDDLVAFVEGKVEDDLQMIRINGAIVGSMVGMGLYLVVVVVERMWGL